jgi:hypothetical protein
MFEQEKLLGVDTEWLFYCTLPSGKRGTNLTSEFRSRDLYFKVFSVHTDICFNGFIVVVFAFICLRTIIVPCCVWFVYYSGNIL